MKGHKTITEIEDTLQDLHQQMALVKEAEANGICKHSLYTLPTRYEAYRKTQDTIDIAKRDLNEIINQCEIHLQKYTEAIKTLESPQFVKWHMEMNVSYDQDSVRVFDLVKEFLQNAGQSSMITQCEQSENDVGQLAHQQTIATMKCLQLLHEYGSVLTQCPQTYLERHRSNCFRKWSKCLLETMDLNVCDMIFQEFFVLINTHKLPQIKSVIKFSYNLNMLYSEMASQLSKLFEEVSKHRTENALAGYEKMYTDAKAGISNFLCKESNASNALEFVLIGELLLLNKSFLQLETAASRTGDWLMKLTYREGDWFLDELTTCSNRALEFLNCLPVQLNSKIEEPKFFQVVNGLQLCNNIYIILQELNFNFHTIILPETMKKILCEEQTVLQMISDFNSLLLSVDMPLDDLVSSLEKLYTSVVMEMDADVSVFFFLYTVCRIIEVCIRITQSPDYRGSPALCIWSSKVSVVLKIFKTPIVSVHTERFIQTTFLLKL